MSGIIAIDAENLDVIPLEYRAEFASARHCNVCLAIQSDDLSYKIPENLLKCSRCRLVQYCSLQHQRIDWPTHKDLCHAVKQICSTYKINNVYYIHGKPIKSKTDLMYTIVQVKFLLHCILKRKLHFHEEEFITFPSYCAFCYSFEKTSVAECCRGVVYCSEAHRAADTKNHLKICGQLRLYYCIYRLISWPKDFEIEFHTRLDNLLYTDLYEIYGKCSSGYIPKVPVASPKDYLQFAAMSELSEIACITYGLHYVKINAIENNTVTIFIVGATYEMDVEFKTWHTKFFFSQYPTVNCLLIHFIGPEINGNVTRRFSYVFKDMAREINCYRHVQLFENFVKTVKIKPTLIISYNCGFSEFPSLGLPNSENSECAIKSNPWLNAIAEILNYVDTPILFTSYTKLEAELDYGVLLQVAKSKQIPFGVERIFMLGKNPFKDLRPIRNCNLEDEEQFYYRNNYIQGIRSYYKY